MKAIKTGKKDEHSEKTALWIINRARIVSAVAYSRVAAVQIIRTHPVSSGATWSQSGNTLWLNLSFIRSVCTHTAALVSHSVILSPLPVYSHSLFAAWHTQWNTDPALPSALLKTASFASYVIHVAVLGERREKDVLLLIKENVCVKHSWQIFRVE